VGFGDNQAPPGFDPRTVQPVASRCNDCTLPAAIWNKDLERSIHSAVRIHSSHGLSCERFIADRGEFGGGEGYLVRSADGRGAGEEPLQITGSWRPGTGAWARLVAFVFVFLSSIIICRFRNWPFHTKPNHSATEKHNG
jgi:hypothetical protein